ncbi:MAG: tetratricopeptide repeat protein [Candidatus Poribacteria bacterium]|nr:tetratricopeptide repeat protein [Candidatus Poribacteria bacterium]
MSARSLVKRRYGKTLGAALLAVGVMAASGCSSALMSLKQWPDQTLAFSKAQQAEQQARGMEDLAKRREGLASAYDQYKAVVADSKEGSKHIDRARIAAAQLQKELAVPGGANYDMAEQLLDDVIKNSPSAYLAARAQREKDAIQANREAVLRHRAVFDNTPDDASDEQWEKALDALLSLAASYESLNDYETAVREYEQLTQIANERSKEANDVFYRKAAEAQFNIGYIYCYEYFDYVDGVIIFFHLQTEYPMSEQAKAGKSLLRGISESLGIINDLSPFGMNMAPEQEAQAYLRAAQIWESPPLSNRIRAIELYQSIMRYWTETSAAGEAAFHIGRIYQHNGDYLKALDAYEAAVRDYPQSKRRSQAIYNRAVCYEAVGEYELAYQEYRAAARFGFGTIDKFNREAKRKVSRFEQDEDGDGYKFYQERQHGSDDEDKDSYPGSVHPSVSQKRDAALGGV